MLALSFPVTNIVNTEQYYHPKFSISAFFNLFSSGTTQLVTLSGIWCYSWFITAFLVKTACKSAKTKRAAELSDHFLLGLSV